MHHGKLNLHQPISASSVSRTAVFTIAGVTSKGTEEVDYIIHPTSLVYSSRGMVWY